MDQLKHAALQSGLIELHKQLGPPLSDLLLITRLDNGEVGLMLSCATDATAPVTHEQLNRHIDDLLHCALERGQHRQETQQETFEFGGTLENPRKTTPMNTGVGKLLLPVLVGRVADVNPVSSGSRTAQTMPRGRRALWAFGGG